MAVGRHQRRAHAPLDVVAAVAPSPRSSHVPLRALPVVLNGAARPRAASRCAARRAPVRLHAGHRPLDSGPAVLPMRDGGGGPHRPQPTSARRARAHRSAERQVLLGRVGRGHRLHGQDGPDRRVRRWRLGAALRRRVLRHAHGDPALGPPRLQARRHTVSRSICPRPDEERRQRQRA